MNYKRLICLLAGHNWEIIFPYGKDYPIGYRLLGQDCCKRCGKRGRWW